MSERGVKCGKCKGHHPSAADVRACYLGQGAVAAPARQERRVAAPATEGMYVREGVIYKVVVAVHGSGRLYAQRLVDGGFVAERGAIRLLTQDHRMSVAEAAAWGHLYGRCVRCQATLTDDESIKRGLGPVCAGKV